MQVLIDDQTRELVARYAPNLAPVVDAETRFIAHPTGLFLSSLVAVALGERLIGPESFGSAAALILFLICWVLSILGVELFLRMRGRTWSRRWTHIDDLHLAEIHSAIAAGFRRDIGQQRERVLGASSEWARAREPLQRAHVDAEASLAYWRAREVEDADNPMVKLQVDTAERLEQKFKRALEEVDARSSTLLTFFAECEARVSLLEHSKRDIEESRRLAKLSEHADGVIADAAASLRLIGTQFVSDAVKVGQALSGLQELHAINLTGSLPVDGLEAFADRITQTAIEERSLVGGLVRAVGEDGNGADSGQGTSRCR